MQTNFLKNLIEGIAGPSAVPIILILEGKRDVNEFLIAKKMDLTINQVRNILYKLSGEGLVSFIRKKDKKKGWYIYFWTLDNYKCLLKIESDLISTIQGLKDELGSRETKRFYQCKPCNIEVNEEKALEDNFSCEECAELYTLVDNSNLIRELTNKIVRKERDLKSIRGDIAIILEQEEKKKEKERKKEILEKEKLKEEKKLARQKKKEETKKSPMKASAETSPKKKAILKKDFKKVSVKEKTIKDKSVSKPKNKPVSKKK